MNNNCKLVLLKTTSASEFILQLIGKSSNAISDLFNVTLLAQRKGEFSTKLLGSVCQAPSRIIVQCMRDVFHPERDSIFLVEIASALSSSTNI